MKKNKKQKPELSNWYKDRYQYVALQRKLLVLVTILSLLATLAAVVTILWLLPLKTIEPYVIQVDQKTGITQTVDPMSARELTTNEAVNNYFIVQYIQAREGYNTNDLSYNYNTVVRLMSEDKKAYPEFKQQAGPNNPASNIARLGAQGRREIKFKSITYLNPQVAQVRVRITETSLANGVQELHRIVLVAFEYTQMKLTIEDRYVNPLGFRVMDYQVKEDVITQ